MVSFPCIVGLLSHSFLCTSEGYLLVSYSYLKTSTRWECTNVEGTLTWGEVVRYPSVSVSLTLNRNEKVEQHIKKKTHKPNALRFWVEGGVILLYDWALVSFLFVSLVFFPLGFFQQVVLDRWFSGNRLRMSEVLVFENASARWECTNVEGTLTWGEIVRYPSVSVSPTLNRNEKVEQHIRKKTHKSNALRFWVEGGVILLYDWALVSFLFVSSMFFPLGFFQQVVLEPMV